MNIFYGNGVPVVVRDRESLLHGEGEQLDSVQLIERIWWNTMQNPTKILYALSEKDESFVHNDLYRILYNKDYFLRAYGKIQSKEGNMTPGTDGKTVDGFNLELIDKLVDRLKNQTYQPNPARREYIEKKNSNKKRPLGIPSFEDKLVQVIVADILNAIYEKTFS